MRDVQEKLMALVCVSVRPMSIPVVMFDITNALQEDLHIALRGFLSALPV